MLLGWFHFCARGLLAMINTASALNTCLSGDSKDTCLRCVFGGISLLASVGLSRPLQESEEDVPAGNHVGTIMYTAPEIFRDCRLTKPGDVYASGIMSKSCGRP